MRIKDSNIILDDYDLEKFFRMDHIRDNLINNILKLQSREVKWEDIKIIIPKTRTIETKRTVAMTGDMAFFPLLLIVRACPQSRQKHRLCQYRLPKLPAHWQF